MSKVSKGSTIILEKKLFNIFIKEMKCIESLPNFFALANKKQLCRGGNTAVFFRQFIFISEGILKQRG